MNANCQCMLVIYRVECSSWNRLAPCSLAALRLSSRAPLADLQRPPGRVVGSGPVRLLQVGDRLNAGSHRLAWGGGVLCSSSTLVAWLHQTLCSSAKRDNESRCRSILNLDEKLCSLLIPPHRVHLLSMQHEGHIWRIWQSDADKPPSVTHCRQHRK